MGTFAHWTSAGQRITLTLPAQPDQPPRTYTLFYRTQGQGPWLTLLHGFPTYSRDWEALSDQLGGQYHLLVLDLLGYGASAKPQRHRYSIFEHASIVAALWKQLGIKDTGIVGHDVGGTILQELLARQQEGTLATHLSAAIVMNSAVYTEHYHPLPTTILLTRPIIGPLLARDERTTFHCQPVQGVFFGSSPRTYRGPRLLGSNAGPAGDAKLHPSAALFGG